MLVLFAVIGGIAALISLVVFIFRVLEGGWDWAELKVPTICFTIFLTLFLAGNFGDVWVASMNYTEEEYVGTWEIIAVSDSNQISGSCAGSIFYSIGTLNSQDVYSLYYKCGEGYKRITVYAYNTTIYEQDGCTPHITQYEVRTKTKLPHFWYTLLKFEKANSNYYLKHDIVVPKGTINVNYALDLE